MKRMSCKELGGACDMIFEAETFQDIANKSRAHGVEMFQQGDAGHLRAMDAMKVLMKTPGAIQTWMKEKEAHFNALPHI